MKCWQPSDVLYDLHTDRELEFMWSRGKPMAHFSDEYPAEPAEETIPPDAFDPYVKNGTFVMRELVVPLGAAPPPQAPHIRGIIHVFYAKVSEAWRIDAYLAMLAAAHRAGWSEGFERLEGALLGYTERENDMHIEHLLAAPHANDFPWLRRLLEARRKV